MFGSSGDSCYVGLRPVRPHLLIFQEQPWKKKDLYVNVTEFQMLLISVNLNGYRPHIIQLGT